MSLTKIELRACEILLAGARRKATVSDFRYDLHQARIYKRTWSPLFEALGLICLPVSPGCEEFFLTFKASNVVAFVPRAMLFDDAEPKEAGSAA